MQEWHQLIFKKVFMKTFFFIPIKSLRLKISGQLFTCDIYSDLVFTHTTAFNQNRCLVAV